MIDVNAENTKPQEETDADSRAPRDPISELARLAANKGQKMTGEEKAFVFEGSGKVDAKKIEEKENNNSSSSARSGMSPVVGGVRVMPETNEELQKILASRLRKTS